jgi:hypothetical protein
MRSEGGPTICLMRYKVKASTDADYEDILNLLDKSDSVDVLLKSPRRRMVATGDLSKKSQKEILERGGEIFEDHQYQLET